MRLSFIFLLFFAALSFSCRPQQQRDDAASPDAKRYDLKGKVVAVSKTEHRVTIEHEEIKDYMDGMTMPFAVRQQDYWALDVLKPGDKVTAQLVVDNGRTWIENLVITEESTAAPSSSADESAAREAQPGDQMPDFSLINQDAKAIRLSEYRGRVLLLTFIYTRCPLADYCPLMSENFAALEKELRQTPLYERTHLLSISFDTSYDTPKVLKSYGGAYTGKYTDENFSHWEFATGSAEEIRAVAEFFGLRYYSDSGQIVHGLRTAVIAPDGKVYKVYRGNDWKPEQVMQDIQALLK